MANHSVHAIIRGRVQGVWYRSWTVETANNLQLSGWVRNRFDGTVEAVFAGEKPQVDIMIRKCFDGPTAASVDDIEVKKTTIIIEAGFKQLPTS